MTLSKEELNAPYIACEDLQLKSKKRMDKINDTLKKKISFRNLLNLDVLKNSKYPLLADKDAAGWYRITHPTDYMSNFLLQVDNITVNYLWYIDENTIRIHQSGFGENISQTIGIDEERNWELWIFRGYEKVL